MKRMSIELLERIFSGLVIYLNGFEKNSAYTALVDYLGIVGSSDECKVLEETWLIPNTERQ